MWPSGCQNFSPWILVFTEWKNKTRILLRSWCYKIFKIWNWLREVSCITQHHMSCQWPTIIRRGSSSPRTTRLLRDPSERVGEALTHLLSGPLGAHDVNPCASLGHSETMGLGAGNRTGTRTLTCYQPKLPPGVAVRPLSEDAREATTRREMIRICPGPAWGRWYRGPGLPSSNANLLSLQIEGSVQCFKKWERQETK